MAAAQSWVESRVKTQTAAWSKWREEMHYIWERLKLVYKWCIFFLFLCFQKNKQGSFNLNTHHMAASIPCEPRERKGLGMSYSVKENGRWWCGKSSQGELGFEYFLPGIMEGCEIQCVNLECKDKFFFSFSFRDFSLNFVHVREFASQIFPRFIIIIIIIIRKNRNNIIR